MFAHQQHITNGIRPLETYVAETFEALVRGVTHVYLCYIEDRGLLIERLQAEPSVSVLGFHSIE